MASEKSLCSDCVHSHPCRRVLTVVREQMNKQLNQKHGIKNPQIQFKLPGGDGTRCNAFEMKSDEQIQAEHLERQRAYQDYLRSPEWFALRFQVLKRDKFQCQICESVQNLNVHHLYYDDCKLKGDEDINNLVTFCDACHAKRHAKETQEVNNNQEA